MSYRWPVVAIGCDWHDTLGTGDPQYPSIDEDWAGQGLPGLRRSDINGVLSNDDWNGLPTRFHHLGTVDGYASFRREAAVRGIARWLEEHDLDPALAVKASDLYHAWLYGDGDRPGWSFSQVPLPGAPETVRAWRDMGLTVGIGSNWDWDIVRSVRSAGYGADLIPSSRILSSAQVGARKPSPLLFRAVLERMGVAPDQAVWVGDGAKTDVEGARRSGLRVFWVAGGRPDDPLPTDLPRGVRAVHDVSEITAQIRPVHRSSPRPLPVRRLSGARPRPPALVQRSHSARFPGSSLTRSA